MKLNIFLSNRNFRQLSINEWISTFGDTVFYLAFINYVSSYAFAPLAILMITTSETLPQIMQIFTGVVADFQKNRIGSVRNCSIDTGRDKIFTCFCFSYLPHQFCIGYDWLFFKCYDNAYLCKNY